jgi:hypothetical protein
VSQGCAGQLSLWMNQFRKLHLKLRGDYSNTDRMQYVASAVQKCPQILRICEIVMQHGGLRIQLGPNSDDYSIFKSIEQLPQVQPHLIDVTCKVQPHNFAIFYDTVI